MGIMDFFKKKPPEKKININEPCVNCKEPKRTLCIRSSKPNPVSPTDFGHANLALIEAPADGGKPTLKTFGNWPGDQGASVPGFPSTSSTGSTVKTNYADDWNHDRFKYVRCKEINEKQYQQLMKATQGQKYDYLSQNCAKWSASTWRNVTGEGLYYGQGNMLYNAPTDLSNSIYSKNGGAAGNYTGSFFNF